MKLKEENVGEYASNLEAKNDLLHKSEKLHILRRNK